MHVHSPRGGTTLRAAQQALQEAHHSLKEAHHTLRDARLYEKQTMFVENHAAMYHMHNNTQ